MDDLLSVDLAEGLADVSQNLTGTPFAKGHIIILDQGFDTALAQFHLFGLENWNIYHKVQLVFFDPGVVVPDNVIVVILGADRCQGDCLVQCKLDLAF